MTRRRDLDAEAAAWLRVHKAELDDSPDAEEKRKREEYDRTLQADLARRTADPRMTKTEFVGGVKVFVDPDRRRREEIEAQRRQDEELVAEWRREFFPGALWDQLATKVSALSEDGRRLLVIDLRFPHPEGWSHFPNKMLLDATVKGGLHRPISPEAFERARERLREKFAPILPKQYRDTQLTKYPKGEGIDAAFVYLGGSNEIQGAQELLVRSHHGYRQARREVGELSGKLAEEDTQRQIQREKLRPRDNIRSKKIKG